MDKTLKIAILLTAVDHMSEKVTHAVEKSQKKLKMISGLNSFGSMAITAGAAGIEFMEKRIELAENAETAEKRVQQVFRSMGFNYKEATEHSIKYAEHLSEQIGLEEEIIEAVQAKLATFSRAANAQARANGIFDRATKASFDLQAVGFGDANMIVVQLGKALQDPIRGMNALRRSGITFTDQERKKITALLQSGKLFAAQDYLMKAVERQGKNTAAATANDSAKMAVSWHKVNVVLGKALLPMFARLANYFIKVLEPAIQNIIEKHPQLIKWLGIAAVSLLALGIAAKVVAAAMVLVQFASGPVGWIIMGIAALAFVLIKYWKPISGFFVRLWDNVKNIFSSVWRVIKKIFWDYQPAVLVFHNWSKIKSFFGGLWTNVKNIFRGAWAAIKNIFIALNPLLWLYLHWNQAVSFVQNLGNKFYQAGRNIIRSIGNGIKSMIMWPVNQVKNMVTKIRNFLPFSPAKEGPLRDIHKIKLIETIAASINSKPLIKAMRGVMGDLSGYDRAMPSPIASTVNGGSVVIHYNPTINGGASGMDLRKHAKEIAAMVNEEMRKRDRTRF